jgi:hypothetical protein
MIRLRDKSAMFRIANRVKAPIKRIVNPNSGKAAAVSGGELVSAACPKTAETKARPKRIAWTVAALIAGPDTSDFSISSSTNPSTLTL